MMRKVIAYLVISFLLIASPCFGATTYYIDYAGGDDSCNGLVKQTKAEDAAAENDLTCSWKHAPGMKGCWSTDAASNCNTKRAAGAVAGDQFIFKGGVTWDKDAFNMYWGTGTGTEENRITFGVDATWFTGASWSRPIFDMQGTEPSASPSTYHNMVMLGGTWVVVDNIEFTGLAQLHGVNNGYETGMLGFSATYPKSEVKNCYFHGWLHGATTDGVWDGGSDEGSAAADSTKLIGWPSLGGNIDLDCKFHDNVIDGSDTTGDMVKLLNGTCGYIYNNYIGYGVTGSIGVGQGYVFNNTFDHIAVDEDVNNCQKEEPGFYNGYFSFGCHVNSTPQHGNGIETYNKSFSIHNNVFKHMGGGANLLLYPGGGDYDTYIFNNVIFDDGNQSIQMSAASLQEGNVHNYYIFNNTIQATNTNGSINTSPTPTVKHTSGTVQNNLIISSPVANSINLYVPGGTASATQNNNTDLTLAAATAAGYSAESTYAFFPPSAINGVDLSAICAGIPSTATAPASTACLSDTSYGAAYNAVSHTITGNGRSAVVRGATWDIGAYEYSGASPAGTHNGIAISGGVSFR